MQHKLESAYRLAVMRGLYRISSRIRHIEITDKPIVAYTDGSKITFGLSFVESANVEEILFIAAHEYYHIIYDHSKRSRAGVFHPILYNVACDVVINEHLVTNLGLKRPLSKAGGIFRDNEIFNGMPEDCETSVKIYNWLLESNKQPQGSEIMEDLGGNDADDIPDATIHNRADRLAEKDEAKSRHKNPSKEIFDTLGHKPLVQSQYLWMDLLTAMRIESGRLVRREVIHNYSRPSRREEPSGIALPSSRHIVATPKVDVYIDISGSMGDNPLLIFAGMKSIFSHMLIYRPRFYAFNTDIMEIDIRSVDFSIGGGTDIKKVLDKVREDKADLAIIVTDCDDNVTREDILKNVVVVSDNIKMADFITTDWKMVRKAMKSWI